MKFKTISKNSSASSQMVQQSKAYINAEKRLYQSNISTRQEYYDAIQKEFDNIKVVVWKDEFNYAAINNFGVENAAGEYLLLLNKGLSSKY